uniref:Uncharacterized protein n=1 Tax=Lates calcarifer TaxID=8187 RepID=A0A4W6D2F7_LATCA
MVPGTIIDLSHVQQQVKIMTDLGVLLTAGSIFALLGCSEIERNGSHPLGVPFGKADVSLGMHDDGRGIKL